VTDSHPTQPAIDLSSFPPPPPPATASAGFAPLSYVVPPGVRWGLPDAAIAFGVFVVVNVLAIVAVAFIGIDLTNEDVFEGVNFAASLVIYGALAAAIVVISRRRGLGSLARDFGLIIRPIDLAIGLGLGIVAKIAAAILSAVVVVSAQRSPSHGNFELSTSPLWMVLNGVVLAVIVAPIVEELLLRGLALRAVRNAVLRHRHRPQPAERAVQLRAFWISIVVTALVFSAMHWLQGIDDIVVLLVLAVSTLVLGLINAAAALITGRLGPGIIAHAVFNGSGILLAALLRGAGVDVGS
jgi:uncharacterized protein